MIYGALGKFSRPYFRIVSNCCRYRLLGTSLPIFTDALVSLHAFFRNSNREHLAKEAERFLCELDPIKAARLQAISASASS